MEDSFVSQVVRDNYNINATSVEKIKNIYKVSDGQKNYCLKIIKYELAHFLFIIGTINYLIENNFKAVLPIIRTVDGRQYISIDNAYAYLYPWVEARKSNYDNPSDIKKAVNTLAFLHKKSNGFILTENMMPRIGWFRWIDIFRTRTSEILDFKNRIEQKPNKTDFDEMYMKHIEDELYRSELSIEHLSESDYYIKMMDEIRFHGFCHHDFANHNVLFDLNGEVRVIDFDYVILDSHLHDLASILIRTMKNGKWDIKNAEYILRCYSEVKRVESNDIPILAAFMEFPQDFWQVGIQYYWEKQPWGEEFFLRKLRRIIEDADYKQDFIDNFNCANSINIL
ncbi:CotS family spore coat protein [Clostridium oryzae]|uniref:Spore coat protein S n=1 Tax=Clostridium oryzae TaxID=1450648 RepID=A0A1V4IU79_9CLOT|nr:CotS family spore coat protein [Clostridium oryzae]OPJ63370.1 spore coat protein S [Clostridium oryzae]